MYTPGTLSVVATPLGNLGDITERAVATLRASDVICCEDTRVTAKLLAAYHIRTTLVSLHEHTDDATIARVVGMLHDGKQVSYVSDAGTPGVSDPGGKLVAAAVSAGHRVIPIPGPSAMTAALSVCGFPTEPFTFVGFPPHKKGRKSFFDDIAARDEAIVLYESTHRIMKTLGELPQGRVAFVGRELTKLHETHYRGTVRDIVAQLETTSTKGEFVIVLAPASWSSRHQEKS